MVKAKLKDIKKQVQRQQADVYGDESISGSMPDPSSDDDVQKVLEETFGKDASEKAEKHQTETIAERIEGDEKAQRTKTDIHPEDED